MQMELVCVVAKRCRLAAAAGWRDFLGLVKHGPHTQVDHPIGCHGSLPCNSVIKVPGYRGTPRLHSLTCVCSPFSIAEVLGPQYTLPPYVSTPSLNKEEFWLGA